MDHLQSRNRRLATYGASRNQPPPKTTAASTSTTKGTTAPVRRVRDSQLLEHKPKGTENRAKRSTRPSASLASALKEPRTSAEDSIYDLPSSDDGVQQGIRERKRKRQGPAGSDPLSENGSPWTRKAVRDHTRLFGRMQGDTLLHNQTLTAVPTSERPIEPTEAEASFLDDRQLMRQAHNPDSVENKRQVSSDPASPSPRKVARTTAESTPTGRRRLIDSLATTGQSDDEMAPQIPLDSPLPSSFARRSSSQPKDTVSRIVPVQSQAQVYGQDSTVPVSPHLRGSKVTYARQRSFLDDLVDQALPTDLEQLETLNSPRESSRHMPNSRLFADDVNDDDDDGTVRSIYELRQAGGNARYRGAVESIFEDIEDPLNSVSGRSSALSQLCGKLLDSKQVRQFFDCGFDKRLVDCLSPDFEIVPATLILCAFALASQGRSLSYILAAAAWPKLLNISSILLSVQDDIILMTQNQESHLSRPIQKLVRKTASEIKSVLVPESPSMQLSPSFLVLRCLKITLSAFQEKGDLPSALPTLLLKQLVELLLSRSSEDDTRRSSAVQNAQVLQLGLSILEMHTISGGAPQQANRDILSLLKDMHELLYLKNDSDTTGQQIQMLYIRVILNITNNDPMLCDSFATPAMIGQLAEIVITNFGDLTEDSLSEENNPLDTVILALGALINLTEQSGASRTMFLKPTRGSKSLLDRLLRLFVDNVDSTSKANSVLEVHHNVTVGYLAVLLLVLSLDMDARRQIRKPMQSNGLAMVMSTVDEFLQYHRKIDQELNPLQTEGKASGFLVRLQSLVSQVQESECS
ncbi:Wings apart-like protein [Penicillium sp. IBT 18751x]|nr:Wings apart-like protein [Penicillium sp. IBT 18751x]